MPKGTKYIRWQVKQDESLLIPRVGVRGCSRQRARESERRIKLVVIWWRPLSTAQSHCNNEPVWQAKGEGERSDRCGVPISQFTRSPVSESIDRQRKERESEKTKEQTSTDEQ